MGDEFLLVGSLLFVLLRRQNARLGIEPRSSSYNWRGTIHCTKGEEIVPQALNPVASQLYFVLLDSVVWGRATDVFQFGLKQI